MGKGIFGIVFLVHAYDFFQRHFCLYYDGSEDAAGEIATVRNEIYFRIETVLQLLERLLDFGHVLVLESLVDAYVIVAPAEVAGCTRLYACARAAGDGIHHDVIVQHQVLGKREQSQLDAGGKTTRIGNVLRLAGGAAVQFRQAVDEVVLGRGDAVIHREVDDSQLFGYVVAFQELLRVTVCGAEEEYVDFVQRKLVGEY